MKKVIPQKVINKVYDTLLSGKRLEISRKGRKGLEHYYYKVIFKSDTTDISNKFFKGKISDYIRIEKKRDCHIKEKLYSTRKRIEKLSSELTEYLQGTDEKAYSSKDNQQDLQ